MVGAEQSLQSLIAIKCQLLKQAVFPATHRRASYLFSGVLAKSLDIPKNRYSVLQLDLDTVSPFLETFIPQGVGWQLLRANHAPLGVRTQGFSKRNAEFLAGRRAALVALQRAGFYNPPTETLELSKEQLLDVVGRNPDRSPKWPVGFVGSISHSSDWIVAIAASSNSFHSLGIDTEPIASNDLAASLSTDIGCPAEWQLFENLGFEYTTAFTVLFSAKEALYKCWYPLNKRHLDFSNVTILKVELEADFEISKCSLGKLVFSIAGESPEIVVRYKIAAESVFSIATQFAIGSKLTGRES